MPYPPITRLLYAQIDAVLNHPRIVGLPLLLLANKQDLPGSLKVEQIRANYEEWWQLRNQEHAHRLGRQRVDERRMASLDVIGVSAVEG
jgi:ADP-ribosylation factor related protein 1